MFKARRDSGIHDSFCLLLTDTADLDHGPLHWTAMRTNLQVPFSEKDDAKKLGARWDAARKVWYVENKNDMTPFARWLPAGSATTGAGAASAKQSSAKPNQTAGIKTVGSRYVKHPRVCDCPPWEVCDLCRATALPTE
jgi:hypothetical protein